ncbi:MAG: glycosyltransferase family 4 protein [Solirubrobacterales bacterium]
MRIQLWSYNYAPEPTGIGPVSRTWAEALTARGHQVSVVAAHPHYPEPQWGRKLRPTRSSEDGVDVIRLPLWIGRDSALARMRQDASFSAALAAAYPFLPRCDARVVVSPCFPALTCAIAAGRIERKPWLLWIQDILPDGAVGTGLVDEQSTVIKLSRRLERAAYSRAGRVVVISDRFAENLRGKGVPEEKLERIYNPATLPAATSARSEFATAPRVLVMGNIGHSQGLTRVVREFEASDRLAALDAELIITGTGVAAEEVRAAITTDRVRMLGVVSDEQLRAELASASIGLVAQTPDLPEFNFPSKLMNYLASALPVIGFVTPGSEVGAVLEATGSGWTVDNSEDGALAAKIAEVCADPSSLITASRSAHAFAKSNLTADALAESFENSLKLIVQPHQN